MTPAPAGSASPQFTSIGGQAVIEGVMMRSPHFIAVAVRKSDGRIRIRNLPYSGWDARFPILRKPVLRGVRTLIESMVQGMDALNYSASVASEQDSGEKLSSWAVGVSMAIALTMGMGIFVALPHLLTVLVAGEKITANHPFFHLLDGALKMLILLAYVYGISWMKDIHRVFQYHGAEHKSIYAFEAGEELTVENARKHTTLHPRCGTSFLLFLVLISVAVFSVVFPFLGLVALSSNPVLSHALMILVKIGLMLPVAGLAYEFIRTCAFRMDHLVFRAMIWPGLILQKLTTREPDDEQLEVALASLRAVLRAEKGAGEAGLAFDVGGLSEIAGVPARLAEFPEA